MAKGGEKWGKVVKTEEKLESGEKLEKWGKVVKSWKKW